MARRIRFNSKKSAESFAKKVDGKVNDCRDIKEAKSPFTVTYKPSQKTKAHWNNDSYGDWFNEQNLNGNFAYNGVADDF